MAMDGLALVGDPWRQFYAIEGAFRVHETINSGAVTGITVLAGPHADVVYGLKSAPMGPNRVIYVESDFGLSSPPSSGRWTREVG